MKSETHESVHHGARLWWTDEPGPFTGKLILGVGTLDEPLALAGVTHLVEHLIFHRLPTPFQLTDGLTGSASVELWMSGEARAVALFFNQVAEILRDPPFTEDDLRRELRAIHAETPSTAEWERGLAAVRYGATGLGASTAGTPALPSITLPEVLAWVRQWFTAQNAVLLLSGPPPSNLDMRLPLGPPGERGEVVVAESGAVLALTDKAGVALTLRAPWAVAELLASVLYEELMSALRHQASLIYSISVDGVRVDEHWCSLDFVFDPLDSDVMATLRHLVGTLRRLEEGLSVDAHATALAAAAVECQRTGASAALLDARASSSLRGWSHTSSVAHLVDRYRATSVEDLTVALRAALASVIVCVEASAYFEDDEEPDQIAENLGLRLDLGAPWREIEQAPRGRRHRRRGRRRLWTLVRDGAIWSGGDGSIDKVDLADVVLVLRRSADDLTLITRRGHAIDVWTSGWTRGRRYVEEVLASTTHAVRRDVPEWPTIASVEP